MLLQQDDPCECRALRLPFAPAVGIHHVLQAHDVLVVQLLQQRDLADGCGRHALLLLLQPNLLECDGSACSEETHLIEQAAGQTSV